MAAKVKVEGSNDSYSKTVARLLVRRQSHEWVIPNVTMRVRRECKPLDIREVQPAIDRGYIPPTLPPYELPQLRFVDSDSSLRNRESSQVARYRWFGSRHNMESQTA
jgi:hypothetical protein